MANFRKLASGKWQARVHKDGKLVSLGTFRTKKEAEIEAAKVEERKYYGQTINDRNMLFDEAVKNWLEYKKANVKESTLIQLEVIVRNHIMPTFGDKKL
ncbi:tyrosine-type recombinase/integrase [Bacillus cabrialesii]